MFTWFSVEWLLVKLVNLAWHIRILLSMMYWVFISTYKAHIVHGIILQNPISKLNNYLNTQQTKNLLRQMLKLVVC